MKNKILITTTIILGILLFSVCSKSPGEPEILPVASFEYELPETPYPPTEVSFTNTSKEAKTYQWDFGDSQTSAATNPKHTYGDAGEYTVTLTAKRDGNEDVSSQTVTIPDHPTTFTITKFEYNDASPGVNFDLKITLTGGDVSYEKIERNVWQPPVTIQAGSGLRNIPVDQQYILRVYIDNDEVIYESFNPDEWRYRESKYYFNLGWTLWSIELFLEW